MLLLLLLSLRLWGWSELLASAFVFAFKVVLRELFLGDDGNGLGRRDLLQHDALNVVRVSL